MTTAVEVGIKSLIDITNPKKLSDNKQKLTSVEIKDAISRDCGLDDASALSVLRPMRHGGQIEEGDSRYDN